jgi:hypothetical protein
MFPVTVCTMKGAAVFAGADVKGKKRECIVQFDAGKTFYVPVFCLHFMTEYVSACEEPDCWPLL